MYTHVFVTHKPCDKVEQHKLLIYQSNLVNFFPSCHFRLIVKCEMNNIINTILLFCCFLSNLPTDYERQRYGEATPKKPNHHQYRRAVSAPQNVLDSLSRWRYYQTNNPPAATHTTLVSILSMHRQTPKVLLLSDFGFPPNLANYPSNFLHSLRPPMIPMEIWLRIFIRTGAAQNTRSKSFNYR